MKIAYLVVAHANPLLLAREIGTLSSREADFFVHIDKKSDIRPFLHLNALNVRFLEKRIAVYWAGFSIVRAILELISFALKGPQRYDYFILLGGSEYPLRSKEYIHEFLTRHSGVEFIDMVELPNPAAGKPISHVNKFCPEPGSNRLLGVAAKLAVRTGMFRRNYRKRLKGLKPYGGEMWWGLTRRACEYIEEFVQKHGDVVEFFRNVQVPDETFLQTILGNSNFAYGRRRNLLYRDWSKGGAHPTIIGDSHVTYFEEVDQVVLTDAFGSGEVLFARKFNDATLGLVDRIDAMICRKG